MKTLISMILILAILGVAATVIKIIVVAGQMVLGIICLAVILKLVSK